MELVQSLELLSFYAEVPWLINYHKLNRVKQDTLTLFREAMKKAKEKNWLVDGGCEAAMNVYFFCEISKFDSEVTLCL